MPGAFGHSAIQQAGKYAFLIKWSLSWWNCVPEVRREKLLAIVSERANALFLFIWKRFHNKPPSPEVYTQLAWAGPRGDSMSCGQAEHSLHSEGRTPVSTLAGVLSRWHTYTVPYKGEQKPESWWEWIPRLKGVSLHPTIASKGTGPAKTLNFSFLPTAL